MTIPINMLTSRHHRGCDTAMLIQRPLNYEYLGEEQVTVMGQQKPALHFRFGADFDTEDRTDIHPTYHMWTSADGNYILYSARVEGYMSTQYDLVEYAEHGLTDWPG